MCKFEYIVCSSCKSNLKYVGVKNKRYIFQCTECGWEGDTDFKYIKYQRDYRELEKVCKSCGAKEGQMHDFFCDMEYCPFCGGQLASCNCQYIQLGYDQI